MQARNWEEMAGRSSKVVEIQRALASSVRMEVLKLEVVGSAVLGEVA